MMPRNVRNFWMEAYIDGRTTMLSGGPQAKDGGFELRIHVRNDGMVHRNVLIVWGTAGDDGTLRLYAVDDHGREQFTFTTHRDRPIQDAGDLEGPPSDGGDPKAYRYEVPASSPVDGYGRESERGAGR